MDSCGGDLWRSVEVELRAVVIVARRLLEVNTAPSQGDTPWKRSAKRDEEEERQEGVPVSLG